MSVELFGSCPLHGKLRMKSIGCHCLSLASVCLSSPLLSECSKDFAISSFYEFPPVNDDNYHSTGLSGKLEIKGIRVSRRAESYPSENSTEGIVTYSDTEFLQPPPKFVASYHPNEPVYPQVQPRRIPTPQQFNKFSQQKQSQEELPPFENRTFPSAPTTGESVSEFKRLGSASSKTLTMVNDVLQRIDNSKLSTPGTLSEHHFHHHHHFENSDLLRAIDSKLRALMEKQEIRGIHDSSQQSQDIDKTSAELKSRVRNGIIKPAMKDAGMRDSTGQRLYRQKSANGHLHSNSSISTPKIFTSTGKQTMLGDNMVAGEAPQSPAPQTTQEQPALTAVVTPSKQAEANVRLVEGEEPMSVPVENDERSLTGQTKSTSQSPENIHVKQIRLRNTGNHGFQPCEGERPRPKTESKGEVSVLRSEPQSKKSLFKRDYTSSSNSSVHSSGPQTGNIKSSSMNSTTNSVASFRTTTSKGDESSNPSSLSNSKMPQHRGTVISQKYKSCDFSDEPSSHKSKKGVSTSKLRRNGLHVLPLRYEKTPKLKSSMNSTSVTTSSKSQTKSRKTELDLLNENSTKKNIPNNTRETLRTPPMSSSRKVADDSATVNSVLPSQPLKLNPATRNFTMDAEIKPGIAIGVPLLAAMGATGIVTGAAVGFNILLAKITRKKEEFKRIDNQREIRNQ